MARRRKITSHDVARQAGVSRTTVSYVLNNVEAANISEGTRQRVLDAAALLGYVPNAAAQMLAGQRSRIVGLVFSRTDPHLATHLFLLQVMDGLIQSVEKQGCRLLVDSVDGSLEDAYTALVRTKRIDGLVLIDAAPDDPAVRRLAQDDFPVVTLGYFSPEFCSVDVDNRASARVAVEHLLAQGHRQIGCITNNPTGPTQVNDRLRGYQDAMIAAELPVTQMLVEEGRYTPESGLAAMQKLLSLAQRPTAVFVASDVVAFGAVQAIHTAGLRIPEDIAVVGFDDVPLASFCTPPLTTVRMPAVAMGSRAGELLVERIRGEVAERHVLLETEFVVRASSQYQLP
ncbi:MAG: LacI family DNA-binding transcriptional regulator [Caldilineaceae bacterium]|nr:LacI family DNA-binding transcriptional regulator [Caldilineaceae bacterium]